jgi:hypothetical protein
LETAPIKFSRKSGIRNLEAKMSYEGYSQCICENGHLFIGGGSDGCPKCFADVAWYNMVDDTNGDSVGIIQDFSPVLVEPAEIQVCNLGHSHVTKEAKYRVPKPDELKRWHRDYESGEFKEIK